MKPLTGAEIRASFVNATPEEIDRIPLPGLHEIIWAEREYLGWRDHSNRRRGFVVHWQDDRPIGLVLRAAETSLRPGITAMCSLCQNTRSSDQVTMFSAAKAGQAGLDGNSVGAYLCDDLACSYLIRLLPPHAAMQPPGTLREHRTAGLSSRLQSLTNRILADS
jgi:hypothetical protein